MARYHFSIYDGVSAPDLEGTELPDLQKARQEAIRFAGEIIADEARTLDLGEDWRMEVTDSSGLLLFRLDFSLTAPPAAAHETPSKPDSAGPHDTAISSAA